MYTWYLDACHSNCAAVHVDPIIASQGYHFQKKGCPRHPTKQFVSVGLRGSGIGATTSMDKARTDVRPPFFW